jgi:hypothetical protein
MQKELDEIARAGYRFTGFMGGDTAFGGSEAVVVMQKDAGGPVAPLYEYRLLATNKTSTMQKELDEVACAGYRFTGFMGGDTAFGGSEVVVVMQKDAGSPVAALYEYRLLATSKTSTMQKEIAAAGEAGFLYRGQSVFDTAFGGREVVVILERDLKDPSMRYQYRLLATNKTGTMEKELGDAGAAGFRFVGVTVGSTAFGGSEVVSILCRGVK